MNGKKEQRFAELIKYIEKLDCYGKPKLNSQELHRLFPDFEFLPSRNFGQYTRMAGKKEIIYDMTAINKDFVAYIKYREFSDENIGYIKVIK